MEKRYPNHQKQVKRMTTDELRTHFHLSTLSQPGSLNLIYSHIDRVIVGRAAINMSLEVFNRRSSDWRH